MEEKRPIAGLIWLNDQEAIVVVVKSQQEAMLDLMSS